MQRPGFYFHIYNKDFEPAMLNSNIQSRADLVDPFTECLFMWVCPCERTHVLFFIFAGLSDRLTYQRVTEKMPLGMLGCVTSQLIPVRPDKRFVPRITASGADLLQQPAERSSVLIWGELVTGKLCFGEASRSRLPHTTPQFEIGWLTEHMAHLKCKHR